MRLNFNFFTNFIYNVFKLFYASLKTLENILNIFRYFGRNEKFAYFPGIVF